MRSACDSSRNRSSRCDGCIDLGGRTNELRIGLTGRSVQIGTAILSCEFRHSPERRPAPLAAPMYGGHGLTALGTTSRQSEQAPLSSDNTTGGGGGDTTPPSTPTNLTATAISQSQINLSWTHPPTTSASPATRSTVAARCSRRSPAPATATPVSRLPPHTATTSALPMPQATSPATPTPRARRRRRALRYRRLHSRPIRHQ